MWKSGVTNIGLRGVTLLSKFVLLMYIARYLSLEELGVHGLLSVTIAISLYFLGADFYVYNTRELLAHKADDQVLLIRNQLVFHSIVYVIVLPLLLMVFLVQLIAWEYLAWFYALLVLEHLSQESTRLLITLSRPTIANVILFLRSGAWVYAVAAMGLWGAGARSLQFIWMGWIVGIIVSLITAAYAMRKMPWRRLWDVGIDWVWIKAGARIALPFLGASMAVTGIQYSDRYFVQYYLGDAMLGVYTFFANIANMVHVFVFTGVIMILYPRIISAFQNNDMVQYRLLMRRMGLGIAGGILLAVGAAAIGIGTAVTLVGKEVFVEHLSIFWILITSASVLTISYLPHYALFVRRRDSQIIISSVITLIVALIANAILVPRYGLNGAAMATLSAMTTLALMKLVLFLRYKRLSREADDKCVDSLAESPPVMQGNNM